MPTRCLNRAWDDLVVVPKQKKFISNRGQTPAPIVMNFQVPEIWTRVKKNIFPKRCRFRSHFWSGTWEKYQESIKQPSWICPLNCGVLITRLVALLKLQSHLLIKIKNDIKARNPMSIGLLRRYFHTVDAILPPPPHSLPVVYTSHVPHSYMKIYHVWYNTVI